MTGRSRTLQIYGLGQTVDKVADMGGGWDFWGFQKSGVGGVVVFPENVLFYCSFNYVFTYLG